MAKSERVCITIPGELKKAIAESEVKINVSAICRDALEEALTAPDTTKPATTPAVPLDSEQPEQEQPPVIDEESRAQQLERLNDIYARTLKIDPKAAIQALKEINRLKAFYPKTPNDDDIKRENLIIKELERQLDLIASYVKPLKLVSPDYPIEEHCRVCASEARKVVYENIDDEDIQ